MVALGYLFSSSNVLQTLFISNLKIPHLLLKFRDSLALVVLSICNFVQMDFKFSALHAHFNDFLSQLYFSILLEMLI